MRALARLLLACLATLSLASVATADGPESRDQRAKERKPAKALKDAPKGQAKKDGEEPGSAPPLHPLGGPPGLLKEPGTPANPEHTKLGETVGAGAASGTVLVRAPGETAFRPVEAGVPVPVGSLVDATQGLAEIRSEATGGVEQNVVVGGAVFRVDQPAARQGLTDLVLTGGDFSQCRKGKGPVARAAGKGRGKPKGGQVARGLWAAGKGRFRTRGRYGAATVRGTRWATVDRCLSTTVKVLEGVVEVEDFGTGEVVEVEAGERHVARGPGR